MTNYTITYEGITITVSATSLFRACQLAGTEFARMRSLTLAA